MHWLIWQGLLQQYTYVYVLSHHFVDEYEDRTGHMMRNTNGTKKKIKTLILATPVSLHGYDLAIKHSLNKTLKLFKEFKHFGFMMKKIKSSEFTEIINKTDIIFFISK
jgi:hypothetical protein